MRFATKAIHVGQAGPDDRLDDSPDLPDIHLQEAPGQHKGYEYSRTANPTRTALEECAPPSKAASTASPSPPGSPRPSRR